MPDDRTLVTEFATALGLLGHDDVETAVARQPSQVVNVPDSD